MLSKKLTITLVRHGETLANRNNVMQGQMNTDLSDIGQAQAQLVGARLMDEHFTLAFSSDLNRASHTAKAIMDANKTSTCQLELMKELRERSFGWLEGKPLSEFKKVVHDLNISMQEYTPEGGETIPQVTQRARQFFYYLCKTVMKTNMPQPASSQPSSKVEPPTSLVLLSDDIGVGTVRSVSSYLLPTEHLVMLSPQSSTSPLPSATLATENSGSGTKEEAQKELWEGSLPSVKTDDTLSVNVDSDDIELATLSCRNSVCSQFEIGTSVNDYDLLGEEHALVVSHGLWLREFKNVILSHYKGDKLTSGEMKKQATRINPNTGVCKFELVITLSEKKLCVKCIDILMLNDVSHLQKQSADLTTATKFQGAF